MPHHTGAHICEDLKNMINKWKIPTSKILAATTDNGANIVCGVKLLLSRSTSDVISESIYDRHVHVPCFAHIINLIVSKSLGSEKNKNIVFIIEKVKAIVAFFKHSNVAQDMLREEQKKEGKSDGTFLYLIQEIATRWNSTFYCLQRFVVLSGHVGKILLSPVQKIAPSTRMLTAAEIATTDECLQLLKPFQAATKDISGDKYVSGSLIIPLINCLETSFDRIPITNPMVKLIQEELKAQMEKRLTPLESNTLLSAATILDPRFKKIHFASPINVANSIGVQQ